MNSVLISRMLVALIIIVPLFSDKSADAAPVYAEVSTVEELQAAVSKIDFSGGQIILQPGTYILTQPLFFKGINTLEIRGAGWSTNIQAPEGDAIVLEDCGFCSIRDLMVTSSHEAKNGNGIRFVNQSSSNMVDFCRISLFPESGIAFEGVASAPQSSNTVMRCHFIDNIKAQLLSRNNNDFYFMQNQFGAHGRLKENAPQYGALLDHSSAGTYSLNYHWSNCVAMMMTDGCNFNRIENNRFEMSERQGLLIGDPTAPGLLAFHIITGNTFHTNSEELSGKYAAVEATGAWDITFTGNQVFSWDSNTYKHKNSLLLGGNCHNWIVKDNIFRHNTEAALVYDETAGIIVKDNLQ